MQNRSSFLCFLVALLTLLGCEQSYTGIGYAAELISGNSSPIWLHSSGATVVHLNDYLNGQTIDSLSVINAKDERTSSELQLEAQNMEKGVWKLLGKATEPAVLRCWKAGQSADVPIFPSRKISHRFQVADPEQVYNRVQVAGDLTDWNPANGEMQYSDGSWNFEIELNPGNYQYQLVFDGEWMLDPAVPEKVANGIGGFNTPLRIGGTEKVTQNSAYSADDGDCTIRIDGSPEGILAFWENKLLPSEFLSQTGKILYTVKIPKEAARKQRSDLRVYSWNKAGMGNQLLVPLSRGKLLTEVDQLERDEKHAMILYFAMIDRFCNGSLENDRPVEDERVHPWANYFGGDLAGIQQQLDQGYFDALGVNTLWLSPITQNPLTAYQEWPEPRRYFSGYHGYWPIRSGKVDSRFGDGPTLSKLVETAHKSDMNVILDFVANHVHEEHPMIQENPDWATTLDLPGGQKNIRIWDQQRLTTWFDLFLPSIDFENPAARKVMVDSAMFWLEQYNLDGFRHDATKHIPESFWRDLTKAIKTAYPEKSIFQIGETFGSRELINSYVSSGMLDGQFDFNLYWDARTAFATSDASFERLAESLQESLSYYGDHHLMGNITGNHDMARFISYASGAISFSEDAKAAGWTRDIQVEDTIGYSRLKMLTAFIMTIPGVPVIYYGDEIGMPGGDDPDNRRMMRFDDLNPHELAVKANLSKLTRLRSANPALLFGSTQIYQADESTFAIIRSYPGQRVLVCFNKGSESTTITLPVGKWIPQIDEGQEITGKISLKPASFEILIDNE